MIRLATLRALAIGLVVALNAPAGAATLALDAGVAASRLQVEDCSGIQTDANGIASCTPQGAFDVRSLNAVCDGSTNDRAEIQAVIDAVAALPNGGTISVPGGVVCGIGGAGLELKDKVGIACGANGGFVALSGITTTNGILYSTATGLDFWAVEGCSLDQGGQAVGAINASGDGQGFRIRRNRVFGGPTSGTTAYNIIRADHALLGVPPIISENVVTGSNTDARDDTCMAVVANGLAGLGSADNPIITDNVLSACGGDGLNISGLGVSVIGNTIFGLDHGIYYSGGNGIFTGNLVAVGASSTAVAQFFCASCANARIVGNQLAVSNGGAWGLIARSESGSNVAGLFVANNYAANGVWLDSRGKCTGGSCSNESCDSTGGSPGCSACSGTCGTYGTFDHNEISDLIVTNKLKIENATNIVVANNGFIGQLANSETRSIIEFENPEASSPDSGIQVNGNQVTVKDNTGATVSCFEFDSVGGGGFAAVTVTGNGCGGAGTNETADQGILLTNSPNPWSRVLIAGNNFGYTTNALVNAGTDAFLLGTTLSGNLGLQPDDPDPVIKVLENRTASLAAWSVVEPSSGANDAVAQAGASTANAIGCSIADAPSSGTAIKVAIGGVSKCLVNGSGTSVTRGDALMMSSTAGKLVKATTGARVFGYAQESVSTDTSARVLINPGSMPQTIDLAQAIYFTGSSTCGGATSYMGNFVSDAVCNATVTNVDWTAPGPLTITGINCTQATDATCTLRFTANVNGSDNTTMQCSSVNQVPCEDVAGTIAVSAADLLAIKVEDTGATCTDSIGATCTVSVTQ